MKSREEAIYETKYFQIPKSSCFNRTTPKVFIKVTEEYIYLNRLIPFFLVYKNIDYSAFVFYIAF